MFTNGTRVIVNRPGHFSHLLRGDVVGGDDERSIVRAKIYFNNQQSHNPAFRVIRQQADGPEHAELLVRDEYLLEDDSSDYLNALVKEALDA